MPCPGRKLNVQLGVGTSPWIVSDELWDRLERLLPQPERRRYPGLKALPDREVLCGILYVLHTGIQWECPSKELGFGSGMTCWRRLRDGSRGRAVRQVRPRADLHLVHSRTATTSQH